MFPCGSISKGFLVSANEEEEEQASQMTMEEE
jgi:hypothetical protein